MNIAMFEGKQTTALEIFQACSAMPFLAEKRLTIVKNFLAEARDEERVGMVDILEKIPDFSVLVFSETLGIDRRIGLFKKLQKVAKHTEFAPITGSKLLSWIEAMAAQKGSSIEKEAVIFLCEFCGGDLFRLENEIAKLVGYAGQRAITKQDANLLLDTQLTANIFKLTDGIGQKNQRIALSMLHLLIENGEELHVILSMIMRQFRIITQIKDLASQGLSQGAITSTLKVHPFVVTNTLPQTRNFSMEQLKRAYELLIQIDTKIKSGGIKILAGDNREFVLAMDRLVLDLCN